MGLLFVEAVEHILYLRRVRQLLSCWCVLLQLRVSEHDSCSHVCGQVREQHTSTLIVFSQLDIYHYFFRGSLSILNCTHRIYCMIIVVCCFFVLSVILSSIQWCSLMCWFEFLAAAMVTSLLDSESTSMNMVFYNLLGLLGIAASCTCRNQSLEWQSDCCLDVGTSFRVRTFVTP